MMIKFEEHGNDGPDDSVRQALRDHLIRLLKQIDVFTGNDTLDQEQGNAVRSLTAIAAQYVDNDVPRTANAYLIAARNLLEDFSNGFATRNDPSADQTRDKVADDYAQVSAEARYQLENKLIANDAQRTALQSVMAAARHCMDRGNYRSAGPYIETARKLTGTYLPPGDFGSGASGPGVGCTTTHGYEPPAEIP